MGKLKNTKDPDRVAELFGIRYPILQGPMGGGFSTAALLAAVSDAGGLGSYGAYTLTPDEIREADKEIRSKTNKPYNINLWVADVDERLKGLTPESRAGIQNIFRPYFEEAGIPFPELKMDIPSKFESQAEVVLELRPAVFSFIFGVPSKEILRECRQRNIRTVGAATTLDEALLLEEAGVDAIVAAGFEAGGHRPSFLRPAQESLTGTFALIQQLAAKVRLPIIAAGGIGDGKSAAAALSLGADAVQLGTAFLACEESNATKTHRDKLFSEDARYTVLTKSLTGRLGRMLQNRISAEIGETTEVLPFPLQAHFLAPLKAAALAQGRTDLINFWSGQAAPLLKHRHAGELMQELIREISG